MTEMQLHPWDVENKLKEELEYLIEEIYQVKIARDEIPVAPPPNSEFGDLSTPIALKLAKEARKSPLAIAEQLAESLSSLHIPYVESFNVTRPGYINAKLDIHHFGKELVQQIHRMGKDYGNNSDGAAEKFVIEHTNINPNKAAHIGHLRNACLGDTLARLAEKCGFDVEVQNYIDDTGTAVADVVVGLHYLGEKYEGTQRFDYFCWDLYTKVNILYQSDAELEAKQAEVLHLIEEGHNDIAKLAKETSKDIVDCHLKTMARLDVFYKVLTWESDIMKMGFWRHAFEKMKERGGIVYEESGPNQGCWVVKLGDLPEFSNLENPDKVLLRSNGTATYTAKDIANQMWKFGILGKDFQYSAYCTQENGETLWTSDMEGQSMHEFGNADVVMNVIDIRQKYLQDVLRLSLHKLGYEKQAANSIHFGYEVVALSTEAARELGVEVSDDRDIYAMAGRRGIGVKADDLIDRIVEKTTEEVARRHPEMSLEEQKELGTRIAVGAVRYYMIRYNTNSVIVFDFKEALSLQGNTGPYLQYSFARASNILRKAESEVAHAETASLPDAQGEITDAEKDLLKKLAEYPQVVRKGFKDVSPSAVTDYAYNLATTFMSFYEKAPVLSADEVTKQYRLTLVYAFRQVMANVLYVLGIPAPDRM
jgi:arginyl-tRNA synthetase